MTTGPATREQLQALHRALVDALHKRMRAGPVAADLTVARALLDDNGMKADDKDRKKLQNIYRLYLSHLIGTFGGDERPSAAMFGECRLFLAGQGITKDVQGGLTQAQALKALSSAAFPFTKH
jgi:hypothetical protein